MGRPRKFNDPATFDLMVDLYVIDCHERGVPLTIPDLALYLGFADRHSLYDYQDREEFSHSVKRARSLVEAYIVRYGLEGGGAMPIFLLKNMGYTDKQEVQFDPVKIIIEGSDTKL
jgi:hypothetical protein